MIYTKEKKLIDFQDRSVNSCIKKFIEWVNRNKHILSLRRIWRSKTKYKKNIKLKSTCWTDQIKSVKADLFFYFLIFFCTWQVQCFFIIWKYFGNEDNTGECSKKKRSSTSWKIKKIYLLAAKTWLIKTFYSTICQKFYSVTLSFKLFLLNSLYN